MAEIDIIDETGQHEHEWTARGVRRTGPAFTLSNRASDTEILWRCKGCGAYEVETVPGVWTKQQLGLPDAIVADGKPPVPSSFPAVAAGAVAMSKETARQAAVAAGREQAIARQEAARHGGPVPADAPED